MLDLQIASFWHSVASIDRRKEEIISQASSQSQALSARYQGLTRDVFGLRRQVVAVEVHAHGALDSSMFKEETASVRLGLAALEHRHFAVDFQLQSLIRTLIQEEDTFLTEY